MIKNQINILFILLLLALVGCSKEELLTIDDSSSVEVMKSGDGSIVDPGGDEDEIIFSPIKSNLNKDKIPVLGLDLIERRSSFFLRGIRMGQNQSSMGPNVFQNCPKRQPLILSVCGLCYWPL